LEILVVSIGGVAAAPGRILDEHTDEHVRKVAALWLVQDGPECDAEAFQQEVAQLRAAFTRSRVESLQRFDEILDEHFGPHRDAQAPTGSDKQRAL
jgi:hypothetical protein